MPPSHRIRRQALALALVNTVVLAAGVYFVYLEMLTGKQITGYLLGCAAVLYSSISFATVSLLRVQGAMRQLERYSRKLLRSEFSERIDTRQVGDFYQLASSINRLAGELGESQDTRKSLSEFDSLILTGADISAIIRRCLIAASMDAIQIRLYLRAERDQVMVHHLSGMRVLCKSVAAANITDEALGTADFYEELAERDSGSVVESHPIACADQFVGVLSASGHRTFRVWKPNGWPTWLIACQSL